MEQRNRHPISEPVDKQDVLSNLVVDWVVYKTCLIPEMRAMEVDLNSEVGLNDDLGPTNQPSAKVNVKAAGNLLSRSALETLGDVFPNLLQNA
ncbi:hypothetical protein DdX_16265 [Ditylenchus destructor]|uniref:Uncharacterized protein n=1 Tax=Ditylenchus destructor TaxID=166010 RepID=A0AAD4MTF5_9BILA|nr:hypothetical protein DdX_16265 [Ditylenchus destructor]